LNIWANLFSLMLNTLVYSFMNIFFWIVVLIVLIQYRRTLNIEKKLFGRALNNLWAETFTSVFYGILGGFFASFLLLFLGISFESIGITYLWPVAIVLFLIHPRFLCFAYAGGIIAVIALILRGLLVLNPGLGEFRHLVQLSGIHIPSLLALVGVLHLTESLLIYFSGHRGVSPIYIKNTAGEIVGGYSLQRFWPLPLLGLWASVMAEDSQTLHSAINMPDWWPILGTAMSPGANEMIIYFMLPIVAGLGYGDMAVSSKPEVKRIKTAQNLAVYSVVLSGAAVAAAFVPLVTLPAALLAPLGHELIIRKGNEEEFSKPPIFCGEDAAGLQIMAVFPGTAAEKAGLQRGDILLEINNTQISSAIDCAYILRHNKYLTIKIERNGMIMELPRLENPLENPQIGENTQMSGEGDPQTPTDPQAAENSQMPENIHAPTDSQAAGYTQAAENTHTPENMLGASNDTDYAPDQTQQREYFHPRESARFMTRFGLIIVPDKYTGVYLEFNKSSLWDKIKKR